MRQVKTALLGLLGAAGLALSAQAQPVSQWGYGVNPATGNGRATYPGDVQVNTLATGSTACVQVDAAGKLGTTTCASAGPTVGGANTWTGLQTFNGATANLATVVKNIAEPVTIAASPATGTVNLDITTQSVLYFTTAATANWTLNLRGNSTTTLNTLLTTGQAVTSVFLATEGATAFFVSAVTVDGAACTSLFWQGGAAPTSGNTTGVDAYTLTAVKLANASFACFAGQAQF